ncbi:MAG: contractile injection system tape measure protein [Pseudomonadota bacterium]
MIPLDNAGLVLMNGYFQPLFERLGLIENRSFVSDQAQKRAAMYLHFLVTGLEKAEDHMLALNKMLCGLAPDTPCPLSIDITTDEQQLIESLINSVIAHWNAIGESSIDGFRGVWLVREGRLQSDESTWSLTVQKRSYDILLQRAPFQYSIVTLPWIPEPIHVAW